MFVDMNYKCMEYYAKYYHSNDVHVEYEIIIEIFSCISYNEKEIVGGIRQTSCLSA